MKDNDVRTIAIATIWAMVFVIALRVAAIAFAIWELFHGRWLNALAIVLINEFLAWVVRIIGQVGKGLVGE